MFIPQFKVDFLHGGNFPACTTKLAKMRDFSYRVREWNGVVLYHVYAVPYLGRRWQNLCNTNQADCHSGS